MTGTVQISDAAAQAGVKSAYITAVITRADGTVEDLGVIAGEPWGGAEHASDNLDTAEGA